MAKLEEQSIDWISVAPVALTGAATTTATPSEVFSHLADHERWVEWFPNVKQVEVTGPSSGVGARRRVKVPGMTVDEVFIVWQPGERWSFTGTDATPKFSRSIVEDCRLEPTSDGGTRISYTMYLDPPALLKPLVKVAGKQIQKSIQRAMENLATRAAGA